jgi:hypothetical protein
MSFIINYFKKYPYALVMIIIAIIWMSVNIIQGKNAEQLLRKEGKFTLGTVTAIKGAKSGRYVQIEFEYDGKKIQSEERNETISQSAVGEKVFIKFLPSRPTNFDFYDFIEVPDSLKNRPAEIWDTIQ